MSDLISREKLKDYLEKNISFGGVEKKFEFYDIIDSIPSVDIMECARAIKEYCNQFSKCEDCGCLNKNYCAFYTCPDEWNLPEGEKE